MSVSFASARNGETPGVIGFLRLLDEGQGKGIRAALFATSARLLPIEFCFTRADLVDSVLWEETQARRVAIASIVRELFRSVKQIPDVVLGLADEIPPLIFSKEISVDIPVCRVSSDPAPRRGASEEIERLGASLFLVWSSHPPDKGTAARQLLTALAESPNPLEPFDRAAAGIAEAYAVR